MFVEFVLLVDREDQQVLHKEGGGDLGGWHVDLLRVGIKVQFESVLQLLGQQSPTESFHVEEVVEQKEGLLLGLVEIDIELSSLVFLHELIVEHVLALLFGQHRTERPDTGEQHDVPDAVALSLVERVVQRVFVGFV